MNGIIVKLENVNGKQVPAVTSQQLAEVFGKEHYNVLRDIRETVAKCSKSFCALNFEGAEYLDEQVDILPRLKSGEDVKMHLTNKGPHTRAFVLSVILKICDRFDKHG